MKASKCLAIFLFVILQFIILSSIFYLFCLILPDRIQDTFQRSFIRQKRFFAKIDRRITHFTSHKSHNTNSSTTNDIDIQSNSKSNSKFQDNDLEDEPDDTTNDFDYNAILTEIPLLRRSTQVHGFHLFAIQIYRAFYGLFYSTYYAIKSIIKVFYTSIGSTLKYALYRSNGVNTIITIFIVKILSITTKIFRFLTYWLKFLMKIGRTIIYKYFLHDDEPIFL